MIKIARKLGCSKDAIDSCILVRASVEAVSATIEQYFGLGVRSNCQIQDYIELDRAAWQEIERQRQTRTSKQKKSFPPIKWVLPIWQYCDSQWTIVPLAGTETSIAFAFSLLLDTEVITFYDSKYASFKEFKVFQGKKLIEHYLFGCECGQIIEGDWDINIYNFELDSNWYNYDHHFKSSVRQVAKLEIESALIERKENKGQRGFLEACLKYYKVYLPLYEEMPHYYRDNLNSNCQKWNLTIERMDLAIIPSDWHYSDCKVPDRIM